MRYVIAEDVVFHDVAGDLVLLDLRTGEYLGLDAVGSQVWRLLAGGADVAAVVAELAAGHHEEPSRVGRDVTAFLAELRAAGLVAVAD